MLTYLPITVNYDYVTFCYTEDIGLGCYAYHKLR